MVKGSERRRRQGWSGQAVLSLTVQSSQLGGGGLSESGALTI